jgi:hypothetical protein
LLLLHPLRQLELQLQRQEEEAEVVQEVEEMEEVEEVVEVEEEAGDLLLQLHNLQLLQPLLLLCRMAHSKDLFQKHTMATEENSTPS